MTLTEILTEQTQDLKDEYIAQTKIWAGLDYDSAIKRVEEYPALWSAMIEKKTMNWEDNKLKNHYYTEQKFVHGEGGRIARMKRIDYVTKEMLKAEKHYTSSIEKLVFRLIQKGINEDNTLEIISGRIAQNFETTIKHSKGITRAFTIIASGMIQRPHYRYLIK